MPDAGTQKTKNPRINIKFDPTNGIPNTVRPINRIDSIIKNDTKIYGKTLPKMISYFDIGADTSVSIVPLSFSLVIEIVIKINNAKNTSTAINDGTINHGVLSSGLNRIRISN